MSVSFLCTTALSLEYRVRQANDNSTQVTSLGIRSSDATASRSSLAIVTRLLRGTCSAARMTVQSSTPEHA